jgi:hypothetical protein
MRELEQAVGRLSHRRDRPHDARAALVRLHEAPSDVPDLVRVGHGRAAELHDDGFRRLLWSGLHVAQILAGVRNPCRAS